MVLCLSLFACEDEPATTGTLIVNLAGYPFAVVGLYDPASVTPSLVNTNDALYIQSFDGSGKATFISILAGNYIVVFHENTFLRKGAQVIAGQTVNVTL
jgi:hypothetical protein